MSSPDNSPNAVRSLALIFFPCFFVYSAKREENFGDEMVRRPVVSGEDEVEYQERPQKRDEETRKGIRIPPDNVFISDRFYYVPGSNVLVVFVHGLLDYVDRSRYVAFFLNEIGISLYMYDQRGMGSSEPYLTNNVYDNDNYIQYARDLKYLIRNRVIGKYFSKIYLLGFGNGCQTIMHLEIMEKGLHNVSSKIYGSIFVSPCTTMGVTRRCGKLFRMIIALLNSINPEFPLYRPTNPEPKTISDVTDPSVVDDDISKYPLPTDTEALGIIGSRSFKKEEDLKKRDEKRKRYLAQMMKRQDRKRKKHEKRKKKYKYYSNKDYDEYMKNDVEIVTNKVSILRHEIHTKLKQSEEEEEEVEGESEEESEEETEEDGGEGVPKDIKVVKANSSFITRLPLRDYYESFERDRLLFKGYLAVRSLKSMIEEGDYLNDNLHKFKSPVLIISATDDQIIKIDIAKVIFDGITSQEKELIMIQYGGHDLLVDPAVRRDVMGMIRDWLKRKKR